MRTATTVLLVCVLVLYVIDTAQACNGYALQVNTIKNCIPKNVITIKDIKIILDKDCNIVVNGCAVVSKKISQAQGHYKLTKAPMPPMEGDIDLCELLEDDTVPEITALVGIFGVTGKCPVSARNACVKDKKVSIAKYKNQLGITVGTTDVKLEVDHGNGDKSCVNINITMKRK